MFAKIFKRLSGEKGFTMLDTAMTSIILATALITSMSVMQNTTAHATNVDQKTIASQLATDKIEEILADRSFKGYDYLDEENYPDETLANAFQGFTREVELEEVSSDDLGSSESGSGLMKVNVTVSWGETDEQKITMSTVLSSSVQS